MRINKLPKTFVETYSGVCGVCRETVCGILDRMDSAEVGSPVHAYLETLEKVPETIRRHEEQGIPQEITAATLSDLGIWSADYYARTGTFGIDPARRQWFELQESLRILRIGRLQYHTEPRFGGKIKVFCHRATKEMCLLAENGLAMDAGGQRTEHADFQTIYEETDSAFLGNLIEAGVTLRSLSKLLRSDWEKILEYGDPLYSIHIPADGPMILEDCLNSMREAILFFESRRPASCKGFYCHSWLLDPFLQQILPETSNIVRFQKRGTLYPVSGKSEILSRLKPSGSGGGTRFRNRVESFLSGGKTFHNGGWFMLREQL